MPCRVGYLPQRLDILDDSLSVVDNVRAAAPAASAGTSRWLRLDREAGLTAIDPM